MTLLPKSLLRALHLLMLTAAAIFLALHLVHLRADFPNFSPWMDWSKYTDEGWYGDAAIRHFQLGHWYVAGDFNPAAALPVWPLLEALVFRFTGVSLWAARALTVAVFAGTLLTAWLLMRRWRTPGSAGLAGPAAVLLLAVSPFCFVFTRLAILEPLMVLLMLLALLAVSHARLAPAHSAADAIEPAFRPAGTSRWQRAARLTRTNVRVIAALGLLLPALVLTKTTALFLMPAIMLLLFAALEYDLFALLAVGAAAAALAGVVWLGYFCAFVRPHFLLDYRYLFSANGYTGITPDTFFPVLWATLQDGMWMGRIVYPAAIVAVLVALFSLHRLRQAPLIGALILWAVGYAAFLAYHDNLQPRYYLVIAVPLTMLVPLVIEELVLARLRRPLWAAGGSALTAALMLAIVLPDAHQTLHYVRHPEYTLVNAAAAIHQVIADETRKDPSHNPLVLSISGSDLSLMTGLPSICDDFGTAELEDRVKRYKPGWYVAWNQVDDDKMDAMTPLFHLERVAAFPAMDDPDRNLMILYRLDEAAATPSRRRRGKPVPKRLQTKVGQQPSTTQLEH